MVSQVYEDTQVQNSAPIGPQVEIPLGAWDIEVSWDRKAGYMRTIIDAHTWWFKALAGRSVMLDADSANGRLNLYGEAQLVGETLVLYRADDAVPHPLVEGQEGPDTLNRLCYYRALLQWRCRNERMDWNHPDALKIVNGYVGDFVAEWRLEDRIAHIYHQGRTVMDSDRVVHLYDSQLTYA